jgi:aryl-alcohol dehydrogenase-like predicted oxidoreductase
MEYRQLGASGLRVPVLSFGAGTFGGSGPLFGAWGNTDAGGAADGGYFDRGRRQPVRQC